LKIVVLDGYTLNPGDLTWSGIEQQGTLTVHDRTEPDQIMARLGERSIGELSSEPPVPDNPLLSAPNCIVTPHIAWATREARTRLMNVAADNLAAFLKGKAQNVVNP
jgi:lactate dehydrogenase-like 2-hydroxyacid dehydrogenase